MTIKINKADKLVVCSVDNYNTLERLNLLILRSWT